MSFECSDGDKEFLFDGIEISDGSFDDTEVCKVADSDDQSQSESED